MEQQTLKESQIKEYPEEVYINPEVTQIIIKKIEVLETKTPTSIEKLLTSAQSHTEK